MSGYKHNILFTVKALVTLPLRRQVIVPRLFAKVAISKCENMQGRLTALLLYFVLDCKLYGRDTIPNYVFI